MPKRGETMKYELKRIEIWPVLKIVFVLSLLLGFFIGLLYAGLFLMIDAFSQVAAESGFEEFGSFGPGFAIVMIIACTFGFSFIYTTSALVFTVLYNLLAGSIGGLRLELKSVDKEKDSSSVG
jgi:hypothetical protein